MKFATKNMARVAMIMMIIAAVSSLASAQALNSTPAQAITLNATLAESLTVNLTGNTVNFTLNSGAAANPGSTNITATTSWVLSSGRTAVGVYAYFADGTAALTGGGNNIPSSAFQIGNNGGALTALTNSVAFGGPNAGLQLENVAITNANRAGSVNDQMAFNIDLSALTQLPAAAYTGTLFIQAQATP